MEAVIVPDRQLVRVFNRTKQPFVFMTDVDDVQIDAHRWGDIPWRVVRRFMLDDPRFIVDLDNDKEQDFLPLPSLTMAGPLDCLTGYGSMNENLILALDKMADLKLWPLAYWQKDGLRNRVVELMGEEWEPAEWAVAVTIAPELPRVPAKKTVLYSMWETGALPNGDAPSDQWGRIINENSHAVIVTCDEMRRVFLEGGVQKPVFIVPLGVDPDVYWYKPRPKRLNKPFTILTYGTLTGRKSPIEMITDVCWPALHKFDDWLLVLKTRNSQLGGGQMFAEAIGDPRIIVINQDYEPEKMAQLCHDADVGLVLSKYEGFGLPFREMMCSGLPVIVSENSGHVEDCDPSMNIPITTRDVIQAPQGGGTWYEPDWKMASNALRQEHEAWKAREGAQSEMGAAAADFIRRKRTWDRTAEAVWRVINRLAA